MIAFSEPILPHVSQVFTSTAANLRGGLVVPPIPLAIPNVPLAIHIVTDTTRMFHIPIQYLLIFFLILTQI